MTIDCVYKTSCKKMSFERSESMKTKYCFRGSKDCISINITLWIQPMHTFNIIFPIREGLFTLSFKFVFTKIHCFLKFTSCFEIV